MVGTKSTNAQAQDMSNIRKIRKPMVEKKRRERMNQSIAQLKSLIAQTIKENTAPMTRVDKADILELAVFHLTQIQQQQRSVTMATETAAFNAGYKTCAREAVTYLASNKVASSTVTGSLSSHLHSSFLIHNKRQNSAVQLYNDPRSSDSQRQTDSQSTPQRPYISVNHSLHELNLSGYSPILNNSQNLPELTSSFVQAGFNSSLSSESSGTCSSVSMSSTESFHSHFNYSTENMSRTDERDEGLDCIDVVTIGNGKENEIGHVIKEVPWRPF